MLSVWSDQPWRAVPAVHAAMYHGHTGWRHLRTAGARWVRRSVR
jgi:hypothetical protein